MSSSEAFVYCLGKMVPMLERRLQRVVIPFRKRRNFALKIWGTKFLRENDQNKSHVYIFCSKAKKNLNNFLINVHVCIN